MSKETIIKNIEIIDDEIARNEEFMRTHNIEDVLILQTTTKLLMDARKMWVDMLKYEYGVFYN